MGSYIISLVGAVHEEDKCPCGAEITAANYGAECKRCDREICGACCEDHWNSEACG